MTCGELFPKDKIHKNNSKSMSVSQNNVHSTSRYVNILMDSSASASIIHDSFVPTNKFNTRKTSTYKLSTMAGSFPLSCEVEVKIAQLTFLHHFTYLAKTVITM